MSAEESKPDVKPGAAADDDSKHINLKVMAQDNTEVHFKIKRSTKMSKLIEAYCKRQGLQSGSIRFLFDGQQVGPDDSPESLDMEDNDCIDVMQQQTGGFSF
eukprot:m.333028 g.333028  ORF g.333028 m.333028 type:complete len:102 (-) comp17048_c0_seq1:136-441(-)